jgi:hypothetical protein
MVVMWCKNCGALLGLRHPLVDWSTERTEFCRSCAEGNTDIGQQSDATPDAGDASSTTADDIAASRTTDDCRPLAEQ